MNRTKQYRRDEAQKHIRRKEHIIKNVYCMHDNWWTRDGEQRNRLSKGKIHCSCPLCSAKTKELGFRHSEKKKLLFGDE